MPDDLVLVFDGVSIGARQFSRYESLLLVGVVFLEGVGGEWSDAPHLLAAPSSGQEHPGEEQAELILQGLSDHPAHPAPGSLAARLGLVGSDGAACAGGEHSIHSGTKAADILWARVHPGAMPRRYVLQLPRSGICFTASTVPLARPSRTRRQQ